MIRYNKLKLQFIQIGVKPQNIFSIYSISFIDEGNNGKIWNLDGGKPFGISFTKIGLVGKPETQLMFVWPYLLKCLKIGSVKYC